MANVTNRDGNGLPTTVILTNPRDIELWGAIDAARKIRDGRNGVTQVELTMGVDGFYTCSLRGRDEIVRRAPSLRDAIDRAFVAFRQCCLRVGA